MVSIYPNNNLCSNIGFLQGANCSVDEDSIFYKEYANRKIVPFDHFRFATDVSVDDNFEKEFFKKRILYLKPWYAVVGKSLFLQHFGGIYKKWLKPVRYGIRRFLKR